MPRKLNIIGSNLRALRFKRGLTLVELAAKCQLMGWDVTGGTLAKIEAQQRSAYDCELVVLKKVLKVNTDDFFPKKIDTQTLEEVLNKPAR